jgi:hypothetical protein
MFRAPRLEYLWHAWLPRMQPCVTKKQKPKLIDCRGKIFNSLLKFETLSLGKS